MGKKVIYLVDETTIWEDGTFTSHTVTAFESPSEASDRVFRIVSDKEDSVDVKWRFSTGDWHSRGYSDVEIVGEGGFRSCRDEDFGEILPGERIVRLSEVFFREAKK